MWRFSGLTDKLVRTHARITLRKPTTKDVLSTVVSRALEKKNPFAGIACFLDASMFRLDVYPGMKYHRYRIIPFMTAVEHNFWIV